VDYLLSKLNSAQKMLETDQQL